MTNKKIKIWNNKFKDIIKNGGQNMKKFITLTLSFLLLFSRSSSPAPGHNPPAAHDTDRSASVPVLSSLYPFYSPQEQSLPLP